MGSSGLKNEAVLFANLSFASDRFLLSRVLQYIWEQKQQAAVNR